ncbi:MAG: mechanosensitive ion channel [Gammaproteobacteria bacterium]|nr:mechanosensitive ion channel [Gammaproteobacteria bacterium]
MGQSQNTNNSGLEPPSADSHQKNGGNSKPSFEEGIEALQQKLKGIRGELETAASPQEGDSATLDKATDQNQIEHRYLLRELLSAYEKHIGFSYKLKDIHQWRMDLKTESKIWRGFPDPPPYSIDLVDNLRDDMAGHNWEIEAIQAEHSIVETSIKELRPALKSTEKELRRTNELLERANKKKENRRLRKQRKLAELRERYYKDALASFETEQKVIDDTLAYHRESLAFLKRKEQIAIQHAVLTKQDLNGKLSAIAEELKSIEKEIEQAGMAYGSAQKTLQSARKGLRTSREAPGSKTKNVEQLAREIPRLEAVYEARKAQADTAEQFLQSLKLYRDALSGQRGIWETRYALVQSKDDDKLNETHNNILQYLKRAELWKNYFLAKSELTGSLINNQQKRLSQLSEEDDGPLEQQVLNSYVERANFYERAILKVKDVARLLRRWQEEIDYHRRRVPVKEQVSDLFSDSVEIVVEVWNYELFTVEDSIKIDGQEITGKRGITVSKILLVIFLLTIGLWFSRLLALRVRSIVLRQLKTEYNVAVLIQRILYILLVGIVVISALTIVKIPLTVFAFLGGALAIGVGFGAQNLLNNFISGIILLLERPIKVGDIIDVDGVRGRVINIGSRCSQVHRYDGIDILIPNSSLLEKNVINWTLSDRKLRFEVRVGVAYGSSTRETSRLINRAVSEHGRILKDPAPLVLFEDFGEDALIFKVYFWLEVTNTMDYRVVASDIRHRIERLFNEGNISIAFPQRDVHIDAAEPITVRLTRPDATAENPT